MRASWIDARPYQEVDSIDWPEIGLKSAECERVMRANDTYEYLKKFLDTVFVETLRTVSQNPCNNNGDLVIPKILITS
jgi:hypothetical protein